MKTSAKILIGVLLLILTHSCSDAKRSPYYLPTGCYLLSDTPTDFTRVCRGTNNNSYNLNPKAIIDVRHFKEAWPAPWEGKYQVSIVLNFEGTRRFSEATQKYLNKYLPFVVDDELIMVPQIKGQIKDGYIMLDGNFTEQEMLDCCESIRKSIDEYKRNIH